MFSFIDWTTGKNAKEIVAQIATDASNRVSRAYAEVTNNLAAELQSPRIRQIMDQVVKEQAETRIDATADKIISERIRTEISPRLTTADKKIATLDETTERANTTLRDLNKQTAFMSTLVAADNDDRAALDALNRIMDDKSDPLSETARKCWNHIRKKYAEQDMPPISTVPWTAGFDPAKATLAELRATYHPSYELHNDGLVDYIWNRTDFPKLQRMEFLIAVMKADKSIAALDIAMRRFAEAAGIKRQPLLPGPMIKWWEDNKGTIK